MQLFIGNIDAKFAYLNEAESLHAQKVLRKKMGDTIYITNGIGRIVFGKITEFSKKQIIIEIEKEITDSQKREYYLHIAIAPTKNIDKFEFFLEKATEIGIDEITPLLTDHSERKTINEERLNKIIVSAAKQSLKATFPKLNSLTKTSDFIKLHSENEIYLAHCQDSVPKKTLKELPINQKKIICMIGPEGDFSTAEIKLATTTNNIQFVSLGNQRLRTETAGVFVASLVSFKR
jgi:16S rRNA (uracil1498-N3)-methyltransferase